MSDHEIYFGDFERDGEDVVRKNLALRLYNTKKAALAKEWLSRRERAAATATEVKRSALARSDNEAAWAAANAVRRANIISMVALGTAVLALVVSAMGAWRS